MDLLIYRGIEPVRGVVTALLTAQDAVGVQLYAPVEDIVRVLFSGHASPQVQLEGRSFVIATVPPVLRETYPLMPLADLMARTSLRIEAQARVLSSPSAPGRCTLSVGFGTSAKVAGGMEEAIQRAVRFLLLTDPLQADRGGGLGRSLHNALLSKEELGRLVSLACERYNRFARTRASDAWKVLSVSLLSVQSFSGAQISAATAQGSLHLEDGQVENLQGQRALLVALSYRVQTPEGERTTQTTLQVV